LGSKILSTRKHQRAFPSWSAQKWWKVRSAQISEMSQSSRSGQLLWSLYFARSELEDSHKGSYRPDKDNNTALAAQGIPTGSITAPVTGSCGLPACTAKVPNLCTGEGARGGVSIGCSESVMIAGTVSEVVECFTNASRMLRKNRTRRWSTRGAV
jgi:hypothetical protein